MRRIDVIGIGLGIFVTGGLAYFILQTIGLESQDAGIWSQVLLISGLVGWLMTYFVRVLGKNMTYHQQRQKYEDAFFEKRLQELTPEELAQMQAEIEKQEQVGSGD